MLIITGTWLKNEWNALASYDKPFNFYISSMDLNHIDGD